MMHSNLAILLNEILLLLMISKWVALVQFLLKMAVFMIVSTLRRPQVNIVLRFKICGRNVSIMNHIRDKWSSGSMFLQIF